MAYFKRDELVKLAVHMKIVANTQSATIKTAIMAIVERKVDAPLVAAEEPRNIIVIIIINQCIILVSS